MSKRSKLTFSVESRLELKEQLIEFVPRETMLRGDTVTSHFNDYAQLEIGKCYYCEKCGEQYKANSPVCFLCNKCFKKSKKERILHRLYHYLILGIPVPLTKSEMIKCYNLWSKGELTHAEKNKVFSAINHSYYCYNSDQMRFLTVRVLDSIFEAELLKKKWRKAQYFNQYTSKFIHSFKKGE